ncbi:MAG: tripartite tricarboxylate transporter substrate binding protein [Rhodobacteraceae bacterium]|nr:tripartite tricarboxylate transporter substrate binding protein [Paracoccaceae bacterium]
MIKPHGYLFALPFVALSALGAPLDAQSYPSGPVTIIVGASAGGTTDTLARVVAQGLTEKFDQPFVVDNRPGAGGAIAAQAVADANADGRTLLVAFTSHTLNTALFNDLPYDPIDDFEPISLLAQVSSLLLARGNLEVETLSEALELGRNAPDGVTFAVGGLGSSLHMETLKFLAESGVAGIEIPFPGTAPAITDLLGGHVDFMFAPFASSVPLIEAGSVKALAVTSPERNPNFPDLPAVIEAIEGYPITYGWFGVLATAGTPQEDVAALNEAITDIMQSERAQTVLSDEGASAPQMSPEDFKAFLIEDMAAWQAIGENAEIERQ